MATPTENVIANRAKIAVIAVVICSSLATNRARKGNTSWKGNLKVFEILDYDSNRKSLGDAHPVEISLNRWHSIHFRVIAGG
jgi:hypothetical protein